MVQSGLDSARSESSLQASPTADDTDCLPVRVDRIRELPDRAELARTMIEEPARASGGRPSANRSARAYWAAASR